MVTLCAVQYSMPDDSRLCTVCEPRNRQTDRQTYRQTDRQAGIQIDRQSGRHTDRQTGIQTDRQAYRQTEKHDEANSHLSKFYKSA